MMRSVILHVYAFFSKRRRLLFLITLTLFAFFVYRTSKLQLQEDILSFLPNDDRSGQISYVYKNVRLNDKWMIRLHPVDRASCKPEQLAAYADTVNAYLLDNDKESYINSIFYKVDNEHFANISSFLASHTPFFLDSADYLHLDTIVSAERIKDVMQANYTMLLTPAGAIFRNLYALDPLHISNLFFGRLNNLRPEVGYPVVEGTLFTHDTLAVLMLCSSRLNVEDTDQNAHLLALIEEAKKHVSKVSLGTVEMSYFSAAAIGVGNAQRIKKDSWLSMTISLLLITFLFTAFFKSWRPVLYLMLPVLFGVAFALGSISLIKSTLSAIAIGGGAAIVGISLNYSLHYIIHRRVVKDNHIALNDLITPLTTGSLTTIGAFLCLLFLDAESLKDFGLLATLVLTGTLLFVLFVLPLLHYPSVKKGRFLHIIERISNYTPETNKPLLCGVVALTFLFVFFMQRTGFDGDLQHINYVSPEQQRAMEELRQQTGEMEQAHYLISEGKTFDQTLKIHEGNRMLINNLRDSGAILRVLGIGEWMVSEALQQKRLELWRDFWVQKGHILSSIKDEATRLGFRDSFFDPFFKQTGDSFELPVDYTPLIELLFNDYLIIDNDRVLIIDLIYPSLDFEKVWNRHFTDTTSSFLFNKTSVTKQLISALTKDFDFLLYLCGFFVFGFLLFSFRSLDLTLLAFLPMMMGWAWILGLMGLFGIQFNIVNVILATFIFGLGDDYSIFIIEGLSYEYAHRKRMLSAYKTAVLLSALTMFIGIGSLIIAKHPAMRSLGEVTVIGMISVVVISYTVSPLLFRWMTQYKGKMRLYPITTASIVRSLITFLGYTLFGLYLFLTGFLLFSLSPTGKRRKAIYHKHLYAIMRFCATFFLGVKFKVINPYGEKFEKPAIVICNHQSQLDLMYALALTPKMVVLTNQWVWNSPFYRHIIRHADFVPVFDGITSSLETIKSRINKGYSILIFPQGHRDKEGEISRFHQGAFYLSETLKLQIVPIVLHGIGHVLPKGSIFLNRGAVHVEIGQRFTPDSTLSLRERAKLCRGWFRTQYRDLHLRVATPNDYFWLLRQQYALRGAEVLQRFLKRWHLTNRFETVIRQLPLEGRVTFGDTSCGYDALMVALLRPDLMVYCRETDEELRQVAASITFNPTNLTYY